MRARSWAWVVQVQRLVEGRPCGVQLGLEDDLEDLKVWQTGQVYVRRERCEDCIPTILKTGKVDIESGNLLPDSY